MKILHRKIIYIQQKRKQQIVFNNHILNHSRPLLRSLNALNVCQINLYQHLNLMCKFNNKQIPRIFYDLVEKPVHQYSTQFAKTNFSLKKFSLNTAKYPISYRGPHIWNDFLINKVKEMQSHSLFLSRVKSKLLDAENERKYF